MAARAGLLAVLLCLGLAAAPVHASDGPAAASSGWLHVEREIGLPPPRPVVNAPSIPDERGEVGRVSRVLVLKSQRRIQLLAGNRVLSEYNIALGNQPRGPKRRVGDGRTPEGHYVLDWRKPDSEYYRAIHISYPNETDLQRARSMGVEPGGAIMIHGLPNGLAVIGEHHSRQNWTNGCIAVTNDEMDDIWHRVDDGTPIEIRP